MGLVATTVSNEAGDPLQFVPNSADTSLVGLSSTNLTLFDTALVPLDGYYYDAFAWASLCLTQRNIAYAAPPIKTDFFWLAAGHDSEQYRRGLLAPTDVDCCKCRGPDGAHEQCRDERQSGMADLPYRNREGRVIYFWSISEEESVSIDVSGETCRLIGSMPQEGGKSEPRRNPLAERFLVRRHGMSQERWARIQR